jgi:signal transduction histidine kinase/CheY-like chemotaxis protein
MDLSFLLNAGSACLLFYAVCAENLLMARRTGFNKRLAVLASTLGSTVLLYILNKMVPGFSGLPFRILFSLGSWASFVLYVSLLTWLTAYRRPRFFISLHFLPFALLALFVAFPHPAFIIALISASIVWLTAFTVTLLASWIRDAPDERSRRDRQWICVGFASFGSASVLTLAQSRLALPWLLALWFLFLDFTINHMKIFGHQAVLENKLILDNIFDVVLILDGEGKVVRMNRRGHYLTGFAPNALTGKGIEAIVRHAELAPESRRAWLERFGWIDSGPTCVRSPSIDAMLATHYGDEIPVDLRIICITDSDRKIFGFIISATDMRITRQLIKEISDREFAARDLVLSESKFSRMFIFNPAGILIVDLDTLVITDANPAIEEILDRETTSLVGKTLGAIGLKLTDMPIKSFLERLELEGTVAELGATIDAGSGGNRICRLSAVLFDVNQTRSMLISVTDITREEQMRESLNRKQKVETIGTLAGGIAHDFNNILAVILGHIGLARLHTHDGGVRTSLEKAETACLRAREMTGQLLAFSRGGKPVIGHCDTRSLLVDSVNLVLANTGVECVYEIEHDVWPLRADRIQVGQVISNLVINAFEAMDNEGTITVAARNRDFSRVSPARRPVAADSKPLRAGSYVEIRVADTGTGIPDAIRERIFDPFFTTKEKGTGLGLAIVYSIVQNHSGAIRAENRREGGSVFTLFIPADDSIDEMEEVSVPLPNANGKGVLLMDDDQLVRESASALLASFGYTVMTAPEGRSAVGMYAEARESGNGFAFCILDLVVPGGMNGVDAAKEILKQYPDAVLLVSSGYSEDLVLSHYREYGFRGLIPKPYTVDELRSALSDALVLRDS